MNGVSIEDYNKWLAHIGVDHIKGNPGSGRYPWGSGKNPGQRSGLSKKDYEELKNSGLSDKIIESYFDKNHIDKLKNTNRLYLNKNFDYDEYLDLVKEGKSQKEIADHFGLSIAAVRDNRSIALAYDRGDRVRQATDLFNQGYGYSEIARMMDLPNESSVRSLLQNKAANETKEATFRTADVLRDSVNEKGVIDIGGDTEQILGVSPTRYKSAIRACENAGYNIYSLYVNQLGGRDKQTTVQVMTRPDISEEEAKQYLKDANVGLPLIDVHSEDNGLTFYAIERPKSISSDRVGISYDKEKDGLIEIRRGVEDLSLGKNRYAQVRIAVDDRDYIKGMAVYSDNLPDGVDIMVNTKKPEGTPLHGPTKEESVLKPLRQKNDGEINWDNPFGAVIKMENGVTVGQHHYKDADGNDQLSPINIISEQGDWAKWKKTLSPQMLSKQSIQLINQQLDISIDAKKKEFEEINAIQNPTVKKRLLTSFADECDANAADLKAAAMPRQGSHVILPIKSLKDNEIYAPGYKDGEKVILIRYPHAGTFEIPELIVNNKNKEGRDIIGTLSNDAVGITQKTAQKLSGADFDGDTVLVIPNNDNSIRVNNSAKFKELNNFDTEIYYNPKLPPMSDTDKQQLMGSVTNLIQDMNLMDAPAEDVIPAVKYSMVVIDAQKHSLDHKQARKDFGIDKLNEKYRGSARAGASTIVTRAGSEIHPLHMKLARSNKKLGIIGGIDVNTGEKVYEETGKMKWKAVKDKKTGEVTGFEQVRSTDKYSKMDLVGRRILSKDTNEWYTVYDSVYDLMGNPEDPKEQAYAKFASTMKTIANEARRIAVNTEDMKRNPDAVKAYAKEVASLNESLKKVKANSYLERQAQILGNKRFYAAKKESSLSRNELKRIKGECLAGARLTVGAKKPQLIISPSEWRAIEAGAVSTTILRQIINNASLDTIREYTMPQSSRRRQVSYAEECLIRSMANRLGSNGSSVNTIQEIADAVGFSVSTVRNILNS